MIALNNDILSKKTKVNNGFSLVEVVLAIGIFLVTVLALVGLLGPTLKSVDNVEKTDEIVSVVNTLNAFLQSSPDIAAPNVSKFDVIYNAVQNDGFATVFVYRKYLNNTSTDIELVVGFDSAEGSIGVDARVLAGDFVNAAGPIYRAVLSASSALPLSERSTDRNGDGIYTLDNPLGQYFEGSFAMEVRIFAEDSPGPGGTFNQALSLANLNDLEPVFTYNMAIVR